MTLPLRRFTGSVFRAHHPMWAFAPESGEGARTFGGRFNAPGVAALYTSLSLETAWLEAQQGFAFKAQPMTICSYIVDCEDVLDLREPAGLMATGVTAVDLACAWEDLASRRQSVPTWELAKRLRGQGCAGIVVPSFAAKASVRDANLVFWSWSRMLPHRVEVIDDLGRLPRTQASWE